jgi:hypothetical protein
VVVHNAHSQGALGEWLPLSRWRPIEGSFPSLGDERESLVVVAVRTVNVSVREFLLACTTDTVDRHLEMKRDASQFMICIQLDGFIAYLCDADGNSVPRVGLHLDAHANLGGKLSRELTAGDIEDHFLFSLAVAVGGAHNDLDRVALLLSRERSFQAWNDVAVTVEIRERRSFLALIKHSATLIAKGVVHGNDVVFFDLLGLASHCGVHLSLRGSGRQEPSLNPIFGL